MKFKIGFFGELIALGFILLAVVTFFSGLSLLFGFETPEIINGDENQNPNEYAYNNWIAVLLSIGFFSLFTLSFLTPTKKQEWHTAGIYEAFIISLFTEMYGFPLTIYILSSIFGLQLSFGHIQGHLLAVILARTGVMDMETAWALVMTISSILIFFGLFLISKGWSKIHTARGELVTDGIYRYMRHPQYLGIIIITTGMLIQWPTIPTVFMWPILILRYHQLAKKEEKEVTETFGEKYENYKRHTPMFLPLKKLIKI